MLRIFPSPTTLLAERGRLMREEEAPIGRLRLVKRRSSPLPPHPRVWAPLVEAFERHPLFTMLTWISDPDGRPIVEVALEDQTLQTEPPTKWMVEDGRLHSTGGTAVEWSDGTGLYMMRGVLIPAPLYLKWLGGKLKPIELLKERNQAVMSVLLEQMDLRSLLTSNGVRVEVLDTDEHWGTLRVLTWETPGMRDNNMTVVEVINGSPEPDGSFRHYWLQVDPDCRPILENGTFGDPQSRTALNAVASTFGMTGAQYKKILGAES